MSRPVTPFTGYFQLWRDTVRSSETFAPDGFPQIRPASLPGFFLRFLPAQPFDTLVAMAENPLRVLGEARMSE